MRSDGGGSPRFTQGAVSQGNLLVLLVISGREVCQRAGSGHIFSQPSMNQSTKMCPCLSALLHLVYSEASQACKPRRAGSKHVAASASSWYPAERQTLVAGLGSTRLCHAVWTIHVDPFVDVGLGAECATWKSSGEPSKMKSEWFVARIITRSWKYEEALKEPL